MMKPRVPVIMSSKIGGASSQSLETQSPLLKPGLSSALMPDYTIGGAVTREKSKKYEHDSDASSVHSGKSSSAPASSQAGGSSSNARSLYKQGSDMTRGTVGKATAFEAAPTETLEAAPIVGGTTEDNIGRLATTTGFLFERFEVDDVEADYQAFFKSRAVKFCTSTTSGGVAVAIFALYVVVTGLFFDLSKAECVKLTAKIMSWTLLAGLQIMPLEFGESAYQFVCSIVSFFQLVSLATSWGHDNVYHLFELAVITTLSGYLFSVGAFFLPRKKVSTRKRSPGVVVVIAFCELYTDVMTRDLAPRNDSRARP